MSWQDLYNQMENMYGVLPESDIVADTLADAGARSYDSLAAMLGAGAGVVANLFGSDYIKPPEEHLDQRGITPDLGQIFGVPAAPVKTEPGKPKKKRKNVRLKNKSGWYKKGTRGRVKKRRMSNYWIVRAKRKRII